MIRKNQQAKMKYKTKNSGSSFIVTLLNDSGIQAEVLHDKL